MAISLHSVCFLQTDRTTAMPLNTYNIAKEPSDNRAIDSLAEPASRADNCNGT